MDWHLGNPNKTGALVAILMVAIWTIAYRYKNGFWFALLPFTFLGICLAGTISRGGMVAVLSGLAVVAFSVPRPWPIRKVVALACCFWVIVLSSVYSRTISRYGEGIDNEDPSISNRLAVWNRAPQMIADAPMGWGAGQSGKAYLEWYQPLERHEEYRTMVNSHLTWLVEWAWPIRLLYIVGWIVVFIVCWPSKRRAWAVVALGGWVCFFTAAFFSSVAESPWLWIVPVGFLIAVLIDRIRNRHWPTRRVWLLSVTIPFIILGVLLLCGFSYSGFPIRGYPDHVLLNRTPPLLFVLINENVMGSNYGRTWRSTEGTEVTEGAVLTHSLSFLGRAQGATLVVAGGLAAEDRQQLPLGKFENVILLNPSFFPQEIKGLSLSKTNVYFGAFSQSPSINTWRRALASGNFHIVAGAGDYLPHWPSLVIGSRSTFH